MSTPPPSFQGWQAHPEVQQETLAPSAAQALAATLDLDPTPWQNGAALPPLWHWVCFTPKAAQSALGPDGHPQKGNFLPPIDLPRRMFAGVALTIHSPLRLGLPTTRQADVTNLAFKTGSQGPLAFVTVLVRFFQNDSLCLEETQTLVYRGPGSPVAAPQAKPLAPPAAGTWVQTVTPDPVLLFRFSALTFNGHRIHYDRPYATAVEGYPGLVVHGPLVALMLAELARAQDPRPVKSLRYKATAPLFDLAPFDLLGTPSPQGVALTARRCDGVTAAEASVTF
jgi:3-methylfumaryl-CoA hydratase